MDYMRTYRLRQLMEDRLGGIEAGVMQELLVDHRDYPASICRHADEKLNQPYNMLLPL